MSDGITDMMIQGQSYEALCKEHGFEPSPIDDVYFLPLALDVFLCYGTNEIEWWIEHNGRLPLSIRNNTEAEIMINLMKGNAPKEPPQDIYQLELHQTYEAKAGATNYFVTRVPGGWLYFNPRLDCGQMNTVFVPFDNEFQGRGV